MFLLIALVPAVLVSALTFTNYKKSLEANHLSQMRNLVIFKADVIEAYFVGLKSDIETAQGFYNIKKNLPVLSRLSGNPSGPEFLAGKKMLDAQLRHTQEVLELYDIMLVNPEGKVVYASNPKHFSKEFLDLLPDPYQKAFTEGKNKVYFSDVFFNKAQDNKAEMLVAAPVFSQNGAFIGVIAFEVDMSRLYSIIQDVTGLGDTGETLVGKRIGNEAVYLNPLRHDPQAVLKRKVRLGKEDGYPIQEAVQGRTGAGLSIDYRGKEVIAAWRYLPLLDWGVVAKIDSREAFADVARSRYLAMMIMAVLSVLGGTIALFMARSVSEPIKRLSKGTEIIGSGNLDYTVATELEDEIGQLSRSFDRMTRDLKKITASRDELNREIDEREQAEKALHRTLYELQQRETEVTALLEASRAVMEQHDFKDTARLIFDTCKKIIGATAGYVALLSKDGHENEVLFLDAGGGPCTVDPSLPMPVRGLRGIAYSSGKTVYENDFPRSEWVEFMPEGHTALNNVMFAPLLIGTDTVGILGLANKKDGFTDNDARIATAFGELASIALHNSRLFELLKNSEEKFRSVVQTASDAIISADINRNVIFWNGSAEDIFGYSADEAMWKPFTFIVPERFREYHQMGMKRVLDRGMLTTSGKRLETTGVRKDGSEFPLELSLARWETREGVFFTAIIRDITEHKKLEEERERLLNELMRSNNDLEQFAYVASHDLQEPLRMVSSYVQLLGNRYKGRLDEDADEFISYAVKGAVHMQALLNDLLAYSRVGMKGEPFKLIDLKAALDMALNSLKVEVDSNHAVITVENLPVVHADEVQMVQVFQNLLSNAMKFCNAGTPRISVSGEMRDDEWVVKVSDNGIGIEPKYFYRIFNIFKRLHTKEKYEGTGIGLAICKKIIDRHKGRIWVESELGMGATFYFTIPVKHRGRGPGTRRAEVGQGFSESPL